MKNKIIMTGFIICILIFSVKAQWQPDVRMTNNTAESHTSFHNAWSIAASWNFVHVVWYDTRDGNYEIYYKRSTDEGVSWGADTRLTNNFAWSFNPSVSVSGSVVHVVWYDQRDGNYEIYYKRSTNNGANWGADTRLTNNSAFSGFPSGSVSNQIVHIVWFDTRDGNYEIYYKRSTNGGTSWGADTRLTNNSAFSGYPSISVSGSLVNVAWQDERDGNAEIYYKRSTDGGINWAADTRLTNNSDTSGVPSISVSGSVVHLVWADHRSGNKEIYYKRSNSSGTAWTADTRLTNNSAESRSPSISVSGSVVHLVWLDYRNGNFEIYYKRSTDGGTNWGLRDIDIRLTNNSADSWYPSGAVSGSTVHVIWRDLRDGNYEIYYKRNPTGNPVGIVTINSGVPEEFSLAQNYPNPFNPSTVIRFQVPSSSSVKLVVYDALGREVETLVNEQLNAGTYEVNFDGSNLASGVYYYKMTIDEFSDTKKMILAK